MTGAIGAVRSGMEADGLNVGDLATWFSAVVSVGAAAGAYRAVDIAKKSHELQLKSWVDQHFQGVRDWADEVTDNISIAIHIASHGDSVDVKDRCFGVTAKLSALVDRGRWYFPNQWTEAYGTHKEPAYRGIRQPVLDHVVIAYNAISELNSSNIEQVRKTLIHCQREFVSCIQERLDPRTREQQLAKINAEFDDAEKLRNIDGVGG